MTTEQLKAKQAALQAQMEQARAAEFQQKQRAAHQKAKNDLHEEMSKHIDDLMEKTKKTADGKIQGNVYTRQQAEKKAMERFGPRIRSLQEQEQQFQVSPQTSSHLSDSYRLSR